MTPKPTQLMVLKLKDIAITGNNPRKTFDEESIKELAESIKEKGMLQPILVRANGKAGKHELVCGERRIRAAKIAGLQEIPAIVRILTDEQALEIQIIENLQRKDVHPMEEAIAFKRLNEKNKLSLQTIAQRIGKTPQYVGWRMKLSEMIPEFQKAYFEGRMTLAEAFKIAKISAQDQAALWQEERNSTEITVNQWQMRRYLNNLNNAPFDIKDAALKKDIGACTGCPHNTASNTVLFPEAAHIATCTNSQCFRQKCNLAYDIQFKKASEDPTIELISNAHGPTKEIKELAKKRIKVLKIYDDFTEVLKPDRPDPEDYEVGDDYETKKQADEALEAANLEHHGDMIKYEKQIATGKYTKAFVVSGDDKGHYAYIQLKKTAALKAGTKPGAAGAKQDEQAEEKQDARDTIKRIQEREARMKELDHEKLQPEYFKLLNKDKAFEENTDELYEEEKIAMIIALTENNTYYGARIKKLLGLPNADYSMIRTFNHLNKNRAKVRHWYLQIVRLFILKEMRAEQPSQGYRPDNNGLAASLEMITKDYAPTETKELIGKMNQERKVREARIKERIEGLQKKIKPVKK